MPDPIDLRRPQRHPIPPLRSSDTTGDVPVPGVAQATIVAIDGQTWFVCPVAGFDCGRVAEQPWGAAWALDVLAVHAALHHRQWR